MKNLLLPLSWLFGTLVYLREKLYDLEILKSYKIDCRIISVGNLTFGGTGKTPTVNFLMKTLKEKNKICVLSRGYGRSSTGFKRVEPNGSALEQGDEPTLLAWNHPDIPVFVCEDRVIGCKKILEIIKPDIILLDDAFQHRKIKRDLDILLIDATEDFNNYNYPPVGRARNSFVYANRADIVFLTKVNLASAQNLKLLKEKLKNKKVIEFQYSVELYEMNVDRPTHTEEIYLLSGIAKPDLFEQSMKQKLPQKKIVKHFKFKDHYNYKKEDIDKIREKIGNASLFTTEKDAVKLKEFSQWITVAKLELKTSSSMDFLNDYFA